MTARSLLVKTVKKVPGWLVLSIVLGCLSAVLSGASITMVTPLVMELLGQPLDLHKMPKALAQIAGVMDAFPTVNRTGWIAAVLILAIGVKNGISYISSVCFLRLSRICTTDLRQRTLSLIMKADVSYFASVKPEHLVASIYSHVDQSAKVIALSCQLFASALTVTIFLLIMLSLSPALTGIAFLLFAFAFFTNHLIVKRQRDLGRKTLEDMKKMYSALYQIISGIRLIKATTSEDREQQKLLALSEQCSANSYNTTLGTNSVTPLTEFTGALAIVAIVVVAKIAVPVQGPGFSTLLLTFLFLLFRLLALISSINSRRCELMASIPGAESLARFLDPSDKIKLVDGTTPYTKLEEGIRFQNVSFSYATDAKPVLEDINFYIPKGTSLAIVGRSGAGKTTLADLLTRCYDPTAGCITLDKRALPELALKSLRSHIGVVSQDPFLFNDTIGYNIAYGHPSATEAEIIEAADRAHAWTFIEKMPLGLNSPVGERGGLLSAGERQRIAIARAILIDPDILILDEATSALDTLSEGIVQIAMDELMQNRTTIVIAHRLSTVRKASQILVLHEGKVVELGSHETLMDLGGLYRSMSDAGSLLIQT